MTQIARGTNGRRQLERDAPLVWAVILNWNGLSDTLECLKSLQAAASPFVRLELLVVDNGSALDPTPVLADEFPAVRVERLPVNTGFAGGCNHGIRLAMRAGADYVLLINNDTIVSPGFLEPLVTYLQDSPDCGAVGPLICYADQADRVWFAGGAIDLARGRFEHLHLGARRDQIGADPIPSDYITGCCMLVPVPAMERVGLLDERYFAYFEDSEYGLRMRRAGLSAACVPESIIWHKESASFRRELTEGTTSPLKHYLMTRNRIATVLKHGDFAQIATFLLVATPIHVAWYLLAFTLRRRWSKMRWFCQGLRDGLLRKFDRPS